MHDAEHRRRAADAERQRDDDDGGEAGAAAKLPQRVAQILDAAHRASGGRSSRESPRDASVTLPNCRRAVRSRVVRRHAGADVTIGQQLEMRLRTRGASRRRAGARPDGISDERPIMLGTLLAERSSGR